MRSPLQFRVVERQGADILVTPAKGVHRYHGWLPVHTPPHPWVGDPRRPNMHGLRRLFDSEEGVTSIEYALIASLVAMAIIASVTALGGSLGNAYNLVGDQVARALGGG